MKSNKIQADLFVHNGTVLTLNSKKEIIKNGAIVISDDKIIDIGSKDKLEQKYKCKKYIDAHIGVILPGFINAHVHTAMSLFRGLADDEPLDAWLYDHMFPVEKKNVNRDFVYWGTILACYEMIQGGMTTFVGTYYFEDAVAQGAYDIGMRAIAGQTIIDMPAPDSQTYKQAIEHAKALVVKWKDNSLITPAISSHSPYSCTKEMFKEIKEFSQEYNTPVLIHLSETKKETEQIVAKYNMRPVEFLDSLGMLNNKLIAAHCIDLNDKEITLLKEKKVGVAHCPISNMKLASGIARIYDFLKNGVMVGLGTDGAASNNSLDMFEEMKTAALLQKVSTGNPTALNAYQTLEMATIGGAKVIGMDDKIGSLEVGKQADIIIVAMDKIHQLPVYNIVSQLVYATKASDVQIVIINGKVIMQDRIVMAKATEDELRQKVEYFRALILRQKIERD